MRNQRNKIDPNLMKRNAAAIKAAAISALWVLFEIALWLSGEKGKSTFNFLRCGIVISIVLICYLCKKFNLWSVFFDAENTDHRKAGACLCVLCVIIALLLVSVLNDGAASVEYPLESAPAYYNPYEQQFDAFVKGQLHLDVEPSKELLELENPYDPAEREGASYLWDRAFYNGKYYSYFGIAPIITVYFPYYLITGDMPSENTVTIIFAIMTALFFSLAAVKWASMYTKKLPMPLLFIGVISGVFSTQVFLMMRGRARFYYIATVAGMAFLSLFLWLLLCGVSGSIRFFFQDESKKWKKLVLYALAGIAYGLLFLSRINMALLAVFVVIPVLVFNVIVEKGCDGKTRLRKIKDIVPELLAIGVPVIAIISAQLAMNYIRFDSVFEFGSTYQLTVSDISKNRIRLSDMPYAIYHYFMQPISLSKDFPMVSLNYSTLEDYGHYVYVDTGMGLFAIPMMWLLFGSGLIFVNKKRSLAYKTTLGSFLAGVVAIALFDFCLGGVIFRYTCDLTLLGAFAAMVIAFSLCEDAFEGGENVGAGVGYALSAVMILSLVMSLSLAMSINNNLTAYSMKAYEIFKGLFDFIP